MIKWWAVRDMEDQLVAMFRYESSARRWVVRRPQSDVLFECDDPTVPRSTLLADACDVRDAALAEVERLCKVVDELARGTAESSGIRKRLLELAQQRHDAEDAHSLFDLLTEVEQTVTGDEPRFMELEAKPEPETFLCPKCGVTHKRGCLPGSPGNFRCLRCGYTGPNA